MLRLLGTLCTTLLLAGCSFSLGASTVTQEELEKQVAAIYVADDPEADITAECAGEMDAEVDATQDCHLLVGKEEADVHVTVTEVDGSDVSFETQPYVPADVVASTIKGNLADQGFEVETVECEDELLGELEATTSCKATPADGEGNIEVTVTEVDGLMTNFNYEVTG